MSRSSAEDWIDREHVTERDARIERLNWLEATFPSLEIVVMDGGWLSHQLLEETKYSFVHAQYVATCVLALAEIERILAGRLFAIGVDEFERASGERLFSAAFEKGIISNEDASVIDEMRKLRNALIHFRSPLHDDTLEVRSIHKNIHHLSN
jgi:hypothetical protein